MSLRDAWGAEAPNWIAWARKRLPLFLHLRARRPGSPAGDGS